MTIVTSGKVRLVQPLVLTLALLVAMPVAAQAPPQKKRTPKIVTTIDLSEVVRRSPFIFRARVKRVAHVYGFTRKTRQRYTRHHRVVVEPVKVFRGKKGLDEYLAPKKIKEIMLQKRVPTPWAKLIDFYHASYALGSAQVGDEFIAFVQWTTEAQTRDGAEVLLVSYVDSPSVTPHLTGLITAGNEVDDARRRKMAACSNPHTFFYAKKCLTVGQLRTKVKCPEGSGLTALPKEPTPRAYCGLQDGTFHGPFLTWRSDGDIQSRGEYINGKRTGTWTDYGARGKKVYRREYKDDQVHGRVAYYHLNGQLRLQGYMVSGKREGRWTSFDKKGKELGSYELANGSGSIKTYHAAGKQASETVIRNGKRHGLHKQWHPNGKVAVEGEYLEDRPKGLWKYYKTDGSFRRGECYRDNGGMRWETFTAEAADPKKCMKKRKK